MKAAAELDTKLGSCPRWPATANDNFVLAIHTDPHRRFRDKTCVLQRLINGTHDLSSNGLVHHSLVQRQGHFVQTCDLCIGGQQLRTVEPCLQVGSRLRCNRAHLLQMNARIFEHRLHGQHVSSLSLSQALYNKAAWENYQKFKLTIKQTEAETVEAQAEATVDLAQRYFAALAADDELELTQAERRATQKNLDRVNALYEKKYAMITDVLDLRARVDTLAAQEVDGRNQVRLSRAALSEIVGRPVTEKLSRIRSDVELKVSDESLDTWVQQAIEDNPSLKSTLSAVEVAGAAVRGGKGGHYPTLSLNLSAQNTNEGYNNALAPKTDSYVVGLQLSVPIYSGGSTSARARGLYQEQVSAELQLEATRRQVVKETTNAYLTADSSVEKIRANRHALASAEQSSIASEKAFTYGVVNAVDVLTSVQNEFKARRDLLKTQYDFITNLFILNRWAGKLSEESVQSVNVWLSNNSKTDPVPDRNSKQ